MITMRTAKRRLALVWLLGAGLFCMILVAQSLLGKYADKTDQAWAWLLPTIMPTLSLIIGVMVADAMKQTIEITHVDRFFFRITVGLSASYLVIVSATVLVAPFSSISPLDLMRMSNLWLGPFQGLVGAAVGVFFVRKAPSDKASGDKA